jgi:6,7-dimethyl-8-ribityllumazine synthase
MSSAHHSGFSPSSDSELKFSSAPHVAIVESRFYTDIADYLLQGAVNALKEFGCSHEIVTVSGALEIPASIQFLAQNPAKKIDAYVALACVLRGETYHFEIVSNISNQGLMDVALKHNLAIGNCILTIDTMEQAKERADPTKMNKGAGAVYAALRQLHIKQKNMGS